MQIALALQQFYRTFARFAILRFIKFEYIVAHFAVYQFQKIFA